MSKHTEAQPSPVQGLNSRVVAPEVIKDIEDRMAHGLETYGTYLQTHNGRKPLVDLYQELLDATIYTKQELMEQNDDLEAALHDLGRSVPLVLTVLSKSIHQDNVSKGFWIDDRNLGEMLALVHSEISEALEAHRRGNPPDEKLPQFSNFEVELADAIIRILDLAGGLDLHLGEAIMAKLEYNRSRPYRHNKAY